MKKVISILLVIAMMITLLTGCGNEVDKLSGTWQVDNVEIGGTKYTISELKAMGEDEGISQAQIVLKDTGKAYVSDGESGDIVDWIKTENGIKIGEEECAIIDGMICLEYGEGKVYFQKVSDSQTIGDTQTDGADNSIDEEESSTSSVTIQESPDKYTWYIKNYVGKNCASIGYTSIGGDRLDEYGDGLLELIFVTPDGTYIDIESDDALKQYVVTGQNLAPNTELKLTFEKDDEGNEYDSLVATQTYEEITLSVKKVKSSDKDTITLTTMDPSPDKYTWYIADYTGRNLANCGYISWGGDLMDEYGEAVVELVIVSEDGSFVDPEDMESLKGYVVTSQSVTPNSELKLTFEKDSDGIEYDSLVESQNIEEIELIVKPIGLSN